MVPRKIGRAKMEGKGGVQSKAPKHKYLGAVSGITKHKYLVINYKDYVWRSKCQS